MSHAKPSQRVSLTAEGGGYVSTCQACGWLRWWMTHGDALAAGAAHPAKCKGDSAPAQTSAPRRSASNWRDREGSTWIDKL